MTKEDALQLLNRGLIREVYVALKPFAEAGDCDLLGLLGSWLVMGIQDFDSFEEVESWFRSATKEEIAQHELRNKQNIQMGLEWMRRSSEAGYWIASQNLGVYYSFPKDIENWRELSEYYHDLADKQRIIDPPDDVGTAS